MKKFLVTSITIAVLALTLGSARAQSQPEDPNVALARTEFVRGNDLATSSQWAAALAAFEHSYELRPHPLTVFNMGVCERALGRLTRARSMFAEAVGAAKRDPNGGFP